MYARPSIRIARVLCKREFTRYNGDPVGFLCYPASCLRTILRKKKKKLTWGKRDGGREKGMLVYASVERVTELYASL